MGEKGPNQKVYWVVTALAVAIASLGAMTYFRQHGEWRRATEISTNTSQGPAETDASHLAGDASTAHVPAPSDQGIPLDVERRMQQSQRRRTQMRDEQIKRNAGLRLAAQQTYRNERPDPAWAPGKEHELVGVADSDAIATAKIAPRNLDVDCKSTTCRISGSFASRGEAEDWVMLYLSSVGNALPNSVVTRTQNADGSTDIEIYGKAR